MAHLRFDVGGEPYALSIDAVAEVARALSLHWIPLVPPEVGGAVNLRGEPLPAVDGWALLGGTQTSARRHLLVIESERRRIAVLVDRLTGIDRELRTGPALPDEVRPSSPLVTWLAGPPAVGLIDPDALFCSASSLLNPDPRLRDPSRSGGESDPCQARF